MSSMKCPQCGLINWATAEACKRCKLPFVEGGAVDGTAGAVEAAADDAGARSSHDADAGAATRHSTEEATQYRTEEWTPMAPPGGWRSPYDRGQYADADGRSIDIDFEVAPFVDTVTTIRDTYALTRSQFKLILKIVLVAVAPHMLLLLAVGTSVPTLSPRRFPNVASYFGTSPGHAPTFGGPAFTGVIGLLLVLLMAYQILRWAVMPSALIYGIVNTLRTGEAPSVFDCYGWGFRRSFSAGFAMLASGAAVFFGLLFFIVPGIILALAFSLAIPIIAIEGSRTIDALRRSYDLTRGRRWTIFWCSSAWGAVVFLVTVGLYLGLGIFAAVLRSGVILSVASVLLTEVMSATGIVLSLVIYLGIAHYGKFAPEYAEAAWPQAAPHEGHDAHAAGGRNPRQAHGVAQGHAAGQQAGSSKGLIIALVAAGLFALVVFVGVVAAIAIPNLMAARRAANEASAIRTLRGIANAEATFESLAYRYGSLQELADKGLIEPGVVGGVVNGYRIQLIAVEHSFEVTATPVSYGRTGKRSFCLSNDGVIRAADRRGLPADIRDAPLDVRDSYVPKSAPRADSPIINPSRY